MYKITANSLDETKDFANLLAKQLRGGELVQLVGDIGAGKTTFVKYLVESLNSPDHVSSPTFTICNIYQTPSFRVYHCDFYRLHDDKLIERELEDIMDGESVVVLEWAENTSLVKSRDCVVIEILTNEQGMREFRLSTPEAYNYIKL